MLKIRCKNCNVILESHSSQTKCCGCDNMTSIKGETITGIDLTKIEIVSNIIKKQNESVLSNKDLQFQEERKNRKIRKLEFEIK